MKISGLVCIRNGTLLDYCWREAVHSMLPVVDEMVICDSDSSDGTSEQIAELVKNDSKIRAINYPWPNPVGKPTAWVEWLNWARMHLKHEIMLQLDGDEVLDPQGYQIIKMVAAGRGSALFHRLNFWQDPHHLAPENRCCGTMVARLGPTNLYLPSDEPYPVENPNIRTLAATYSGLNIFHYGFLRKNEAFYRKSDVVQKMFTGGVDKRITDQEAAGLQWNARDYFDGLPLREYHGPHPVIAHQWLKDRGYNL